MSLRITPAATHPTSTTNTQPSKLTPTTPSSSVSRGAPSAPGLPDTLRLSHHPATLSSSSSSSSSSHPLESRLSNWQSTQSQLQTQLLRRTFGLALPLRIGMERQIVSAADGMRPSCLGAPARVHDDILSGRDASVDWEDVYAGQDGARNALARGGDGAVAGVNEEMEVKVGMGKW